MAVSELEIEPDLNKAPPHVEGELLKQNNKAVISKWRKYFFVVSGDKLHFYSKKEDYQGGKNNNVTCIRLLRVIDISESVFNKVPRKSHLNSGFSVTEKTLQGEQVYNLLAESPEMMRYWVHALRYVKAYWSKKQVRETVINEEMDKKLLDQLLKEEEDEDEENDYLGQYSINDRQDNENKSMSIPICFADASKVTYKLSASDKVSDLLDKVSVKLSSSAAQIWIVDNHGKEYSLDPDDSLGLYTPSIQQFYAVDPTHRVIVVFIADTDEFVSTIVPFKITTQEVITDPDIAPKLDIAGVANRGLFLKKKSAELFQSTECPCEALFTEKDGMIQRIQDGGHLVIMNKALDRGRPSKWKHPKSLRESTQDSKSASILQSEIEEEEAQQRALSKVQHKRKLIIAQREYRPIPKVKEEDEHSDITVITAPIRNSYTPPSPRHEFKLPDKRSQSEVGRNRSRAFVQTTLDLPEMSPLTSPTKQIKSTNRETCKSPDFCDVSDTDQDTMSTEGSSPLVRRKAVRSRNGRLSPSLYKSSFRMRNEFRLEDLTTNGSRSSSFAVTPSIATNDPEYSYIEEEEIRMEQLFSTSFQEKEDEERIRAELDRQTSSTTTTTLDVLNNTKQDMTEETPDDVDEEVEINLPLFIQFDSLRNEKESSSGHTVAPITMHRPSILKIILHQSQASTSPSHGSEMDAISLSGVVLCLRNNIWQLHDGHSFHDPALVEDDKESVMERYPLPGGIIAVYNHTKNCWFVLPPPEATMITNNSQPNTEYDPDSEAMRVFAHHQFLQKRIIVTEIGSSFNEVLEQFKDCKSSEDKKRVGSDMANNTIGHIIRGRFCTSIAALLLDGLRLQKLGFVQQDSWKVVNAFCQEGYNLYSASDSNIYAIIESRVLKPIRGEGRLTNNHMRFRAFVCLCISRGIFLQWMTDLPLLKETIKKYYFQDSFMYLASIIGDPTYDKLYEEIILSLQPLPFIPFQLSLSFEVQTLSHLSIPTSNSRSVSPVTSPLHSPIISKGQPPFSLTEESQPKSVIESTGQRTNDPVTSLVNENFSENTSSLKKPQLTKPVSILESLTVDSISSSQNSPKWLQKITASITNLNMGGALTGPPATQRQPSTAVGQTVSVVLPQEDTKESYVKALYDNIDVGLKELKFSKGDTLRVKETVDENWLLCIKGNDSGIVPVNYVKPVV